MTNDWTWIKCGPATVLSLLSALVALAPLAHAKPPDQTWIPGIYDTADSDDPILLATSMASLVEGNLLLVRITWTRPTALPTAGPVVSAAALHTSPARAPPQF